MARRQVPVKPMQRALGSDYDENEDLGKLAYLAQMQNDPQVDVSGTSQPMVAEQQQFQDVPRQMSVRESVEEDFQPGDLTGLELLGKIAQNEASEDALDALTETEPPEQYQLGGLEQLAPQEVQEQEQEVFQIPQDEQGGMMKPIDVIRMRVQEEPELLSMLPEETQRLLQEPDSLQAQRLVQEAEEMSTPTVGATEAGLDDPKVAAILERVDNLEKDVGYPQEVKEKAKHWEEYYKGEMGDISNEAKLLGQKAQNGELTQNEIIALGLATVIPALLALVYGKEAALGAIGGGMQGAAKFMEGKQKGATDALKGLKDLEKRKVDLMDKDNKFREDFNKTITEPTVRKLVKERGYEPLPEYETVGIKVLPEMGVYLRGDITDSDAKQFEKEWPDDRKAFALQKEIDRSLSDIDDVMEVIRELDPSYYNTFLSKIKGFDTAGLLDAWGKTVPKVDMMIDGKVEKVNPLQQLSAMVNKFQTLYIKQAGLGNRLTDNVKTHASEVIPNPSDPMMWLASDASDLQNKVKTLRNVLNRGFVEDASARGYVRGTLAAQYPSSDMQVYRSAEPVQEQLKRQLVSGADLSNIITP